MSWIASSERSGASPGTDARGRQPVSGDDDAAIELEGQNGRAVWHGGYEPFEIALKVGQQMRVIDLQQLNEACALVLGPEPHESPPRLRRTPSVWNYSPPRWT